MKTTDSKDLGKVSKILPIMQEHFGKSMNLARIKFMAFMLHALCVVQTVSLHKLAAAMPTPVERDSNLRRIQRFIAKYALNLDFVARMIFSLLPVKTGLVLSMDRTNWKFGDFDINILMLGVTYKGIAFPLMFSLLLRKAIPIGRNARLSWNALSGCSVPNALTALPPTGNLSARNGSVGSTAIIYGIISESGRTSGLSSRPPERKSVHGGFSIP